jgi:hypothetical protein
MHSSFTHQARMQLNIDLRSSFERSFGALHHGAVGSLLVMIHVQENSTSFPWCVTELKMLGWLVVIAHADAPAPVMRDGPRTLASWQTSLGGLDWIEAMVAKGAAKWCSGNGYPSRYLTSAAEVLPLIYAGRPPAHAGMPVIGDDYVLPSGWSGDFMSNADCISTCKVADPIAIEAWDQS